MEMVVKGADFECLTKRPLGPQRLCPTEGLPPPQDLKSVKLVMTWSAFWEVDGMRHCHGDDEVVAGGKQWDAILFVHAMCVADLAPTTLHGLDALAVIMLPSEIDTLLVQPLPFHLEVEPSGLELIRGLICCGSRPIVVDCYHVLVVHEEFLGGMMTPQALVLIGVVGEH